MQKEKGIFPPQRDPAHGGTTLLIGIIIIVAAALVLFGGVFAWQYFTKSQTPSTNDQLNPNVQNLNAETADNFPEINYLTGIVGIRVLYDSGLKVNNADDAKMVFNKWATYLIENNKQIEPLLGSSPEFTKVDIQGTYKGIKYWIVTFKYKMSPNEFGNSTVSISENGEIVNLLGGT